MEKLKISSTDKWLFGVCGGIAEFFGISSTIIRLIFIIGSPVTFWIYLILNFSLEEKRSL
ncbi:PspC domain-containing protein [Jeotgalibacillus marinus]|uniref:PspC domain-containing protein n=1 Tax=Jeotgalibacillus marinus TaxID=86667 RepID=A0ABV3Q5K0_9BACL